MFKGKFVVLKNSRNGLSSGAPENRSSDHWKNRRRYRKGGRQLGRIIFPLLLLCALVITLVAADYWINHGKIYRGVSVGGVSLGGKSPKEAQDILRERTSGLGQV